MMRLTLEEQTIANKKEAPEAMPRVQLDVWKEAVQTMKPNSFKYVFVKSYCECLSSLSGNIH